MRPSRWIAVSLVILIAAGAAFGSKKKKKKDQEPVTQTLPLLPDPPAATVGETRRLVYRVSPLSAKGLLTAQAREALKGLIRDHRGASIVHLRAFVAGTGDVRRIQTLVSEVFTEKKLQMPSLSVVQAGGLPLEGAQVVIESTAVDRKELNPQGVAFLSGQPAATPQRSIAQLGAALAGVGLTGSRVLRATCFLSTLDTANDARSALIAAFPSAAINVTAMQRVPVEPAAECEAVAALERPVDGPAQMLNPEGLPASPERSQVALVGAAKLVFTGEQLGFQQQDKDIRLAYERLGKTLNSQHAAFSDVVLTHVYSLSGGVTARIKQLRFEFLDAKRPPATTVLPIEGLPSVDADFGIDAVAVAP